MPNYLGNLKSFWAEPCYIVKIFTYTCIASAGLLELNPSLPPLLMIFSRKTNLSQTGPPPTPVVRHVPLNYTIVNFALNLIKSIVKEESINIYFV